MVSTDKPLITLDSINNDHTEVSQHIRPTAPGELVAYFRDQHDSILSAQLTARNLTTYAEDALSGLIGLVEDSKLACSHAGQLDTTLSGEEQDRQGLEFVKLDYDVIDNTLDHISRIQDSVSTLPSRISKISRPVSDIFVPPDDKPTNITPSDGSFEKPKEKIPKLQTLLLLLEQEFDVDLDNPTQISLLNGSVDGSMIRETGYDLVVASIPNSILKDETSSATDTEEIIDRESKFIDKIVKIEEVTDDEQDQIRDLNSTKIILSCDEIGNTTFVFDLNDLNSIADINYTPIDLANMSKEGLKDLIASFPTIGINIDYSKNYVDHLMGAINKDFQELAQSGSARVSQTTTNTSKPKVSQNILKPKALLARDDELSRRGLAIELGVDKRTIGKAIQEILEDNALSQQFGSVALRRFGTKATEAFNTHQQRMIIEVISRHKNSSK